MGSTLGLRVDNAFLCHYEKVWLNECPLQFKPVVYKCYVNSIVVLFMFKSKIYLELFVNYINSKHKNMKITFKVENLNIFWFQVGKITCENKRFATSIFHNDKFCRIFTNYDT